jgi:hypothetical protein
MLKFGKYKIMTLKETLMKDSWNYDFPISNVQAEAIVCLIDRVAIGLLDYAKEYEIESGNVICHDDRDSKELLEIYKKEKGL